ncbi:hypothetical protein [uncultured Tenacibaculum sp.]|uniref:hypothetical protein n=1 Tax=uncultured Tenacibaculum sp. TaxID=174713 RepID=UPI002639AA4A|nr:hypothetical protein [uncultured Tenacibaculum sp.]
MANTEIRQCSDITNPAGICIKDFTVNELNSEISFGFKRNSINPLQPLNATQVDNEGNLNVSSIVFIDHSLTINEQNTHVKQYLSYLNPDGSGEYKPFLNFYIIYDATPTQNKNFKAYQFNFTAVWGNKGYTPNPIIKKELPAPTLNNINFINTFLMDLDPELSRGTVTTVKRPN